MAECLLYCQCLCSRSTGYRFYWHNLELKISVIADNFEFQTFFSGLVVDLNSDPNFSIFLHRKRFSLSFFFFFFLKQNFYKDMNNEFVIVNAFSPYLETRSPYILINSSQLLICRLYATPPSMAAGTTTQAPLSGRVAIITGASRGIGRGIALHLASLGANLVLNYSASSTQAEQLAAEINSLSPSQPRATAFRSNVSDPSAVKALFDHAQQTFGGDVHILVNCAGIIDPTYPTLANTPEAEWDKVFAVNARGGFLCCREAANRIVRGGTGRIICITSSMVGELFPGFAAYAASKAAVETMVRILAKELKGTRITANCVAPGLIVTDMFYAGGMSEEAVKKVIDNIPLSRLGEPKDVAPLVGFLASDAGEWVNGQVIRANGGSV
ncbi:NADPH-dependent aldehyde reductase-like protein, chloroplastic [Aristolochia californica]|uniref:NADPH-dependent aldehyde reductase-like protein, chloroplastic n=1 Tax=Aristolochia californica TaxID=171875 RepID=UPI0035E2C181